MPSIPMLRPAEFVVFPICMVNTRHLGTLCRASRLLRDNRGPVEKGPTDQPSGLSVRPVNQASHAMPASRQVVNTDLSLNSRFFTAVWPVVP